MKKHWLMSAAMLTLLSTGAFAADDAGTTTGSPGKFHQWTLTEARKHAHEKADKLDKMTEAEYAQDKQSKHDKWKAKQKAKWDAMTPEEQQAYKTKHPRFHSDTSSAAPSASPAAMSPAPAAAAPVMPSPSAAAPAASPSPVSPTVPAEMSAPPMPTTQPKP